MTQTLKGEEDLRFESEIRKSNRADQPGSFSGFQISVSNLKSSSLLPSAKTVTNPIRP
jgi:hypothetical protein